ncbi:hypothetical protein BX600DRAFT_504586 [Xylariales sp. PMI_506]|nr:hypothetical protein BX600DRAFT_504586 [Xylariales sp. PMI_506]
MGHPTMKYSKIPFDEAGDEIGSALIEKERSEGDSLKSRTRLPWILASVSGCLNILLIAALLTTRLRSGQPLGSFEAGFETEFADARDTIEVVETRFNGSPSFTADGTIFIPNPDPIRYVGDPSLHPEIDENWDKLTYGRYFRITPEEMSEAFGEGFEQYWDEKNGGYVVGIDMFHTLHCVNDLRRNFYPEHYEDIRNTSASTLEMHRSHCLEQLRQYVMCHGDLTPVPSKYFEVHHKAYVMSDVKHTCRDFGKIQSWLMDRHHGESMVHSQGYQPPPSQQ